MDLTKVLQQKVADYTPSVTVRDVLNSSHVLLLSSISGGGKDTIKNRLLASGNYHHIISFTTRVPRENHGTLEQDGVDYHFIDLATAEQMLDQGKYIEADIYAGNVYGTAISDIIEANESNKIAITDLTIEGAFHYLRMAPNVKAVFLLPPNFAVWMDRLKRRSGGEHTEDMHLRLQEAVDEIERALSADNIYIVVNDDLDDTIEVVDDIAHDKPVEPHYHKAMRVAEDLLDSLHQELAKTE